MKKVLFLIAALSSVIDIYAQFVQKKNEVEYFDNLYFFNNQLGFVSGKEIYRTDDGGENWTEIGFKGPGTWSDSIIYETQQNHHFYFFDELNGVAVTKSMFTLGGGAMKTSDGGRSWKMTFIDQALDDPYNDGFNAIYFFDINNGFAVGGEGRRITTTDGGNTWNRNDLPVNANFYKIEFISATEGFIYGYDTNLKTVDGGVTWQVTTTAEKNEFFINAEIGYKILNSEIYKTTNGGNSWIKYVRGLPTGSLDRIVYADLQTAYISGRFEGNRNFLVTRNGGDLWEPAVQEFQYAFSGVHFADANNGVASAYSYLGKTTEGLGKTAPVAHFNYEYSDTLVCTGTSVVFTNTGHPSYQHTWYLNGVQISTDLNFEFTIPDYQSYTIKLVTTHDTHSSSFQTTIKIPEPTNYPPIQENYLNQVCFNQPVKVYMSSQPHNDLDYELWVGGVKSNAVSTRTYYGITFNLEEGIDTTSYFTIKAVPKVRSCGSSYPSKTWLVHAMPERFDLIAEVLPTSVICKDSIYRVKIENPYSKVWYELNWGGSYLGSTSGTDSIIYFTLPTWVNNGDLRITTHTACSQFDTVLSTRASTVTAQYSIENPGVFRNESMIINSQVNGVEFNWKFGEDASPAFSTLAQPEPVNYSTGGPKLIELLVRDEGGCISRKDTLIVVADIAPALGLQQCDESINLESLVRYVPFDSKTDINGNIIQTGYIANDSYCCDRNSHAMFVHKYDPSGNLMWKKEIDPTGAPWSSFYYHGSYGRSVTTDEYGNVYLVMDFYDFQVNIDGTYIGSHGENLPGVRTLQQAAVLKFSPEGELMWHILADDPTLGATNLFLGADIEIDSQGSLYFILSAKQGPEGKVFFPDGFELTPYPELGKVYGSFILVKITPEGKYEGHWLFGGHYGGMSNYLYTSYAIDNYYYPNNSKPNMVIDENDQLVISGIYTGGYRPEENQLYYEFGDHRISATDSEYIYLAYFKDGAWTNAVLGPKFSEYHSNVEDNSSWQKFVDNIQLDPSGEYIYATGHWWGFQYGYNTSGVIFNGQVTTERAHTYVTKMDFSGNVQWVNFQDNIIYQNLQVNPITGDVYTIGTFDTFATFNALDENPKGVRSLGGKDPFIAQFDKDSGILIGVNSYGTSSLDEITMSDGDFRCGKFSFIGRKDGESFFKEISLTGNCSEQPPILSLNEVVTVMCQGDSIQMNASGATYYQWIPTQNVSDPTSPTTWISSGPLDTSLTNNALKYTLIGYSEQGCMASENVEINIERPTIVWHDQLEDGILSVPMIVDSPTEGNFIWSFSDNGTEQGDSIVHTFPDFGSYEVTVTGENSCGIISDTRNIELVCLPPTDELYPGWGRYNPEEISLSFDVSGNYVARWHWDFGDGTTSDEQFPTHQYPEHKVYHASITGSNACGSNTREFDVDVTCQTLEVDFDVAINGLTVEITNLSKHGTYHGWVFGDGSISSEFNPIHTYSAPGTYKVGLFISNDCTGLKYLSKDIVVDCNGTIDPKIEFTKTERVLTVINTSDNAAFATWDFGDGQTSSSLSPVHEYATAGTYEVCVTMEDACHVAKYTVCNSITITCSTTIIPSIEYSQNDKVVSFTNTSANVTRVLWNFGDGETSAAFSPTHEYNETGNYSACVILSNDACLQETEICKDISLTCSQSIVPQLAIDQNNFEISVSNTSLFAENAVWDFGDGQSSTEFSPTHEFQQLGSYNICVTLSNSCDEVIHCEEIQIILTGLPEPNSSGISVYPNPVSEFLVVWVNKPRAVKLIELLDNTGKSVLKVSSEKITSENKISTSMLPSGVYFIKVFFEQSATVMKVAKY